MKIKNAQAKKTGLQKVELYYPKEWEPAIINLCEKSAKKHGGYICADLSLPRKPRTTGGKSQNHHINGHCQQIAMETGNSFSVVKMAMKTEAITEGYPFETLPDGTVWPKSEADIDTVQAGILIETIHRMAAEWDIKLIEDKNGIPKS